MFVLGGKGAEEKRVRIKLIIISIITRILNNEGCEWTGASTQLGIAKIRWKVHCTMFNEGCE